MASESSPKTSSLSTQIKKQASSILYWCFMIVISLSFFTLTAGLNRLQTLDRTIERSLTYYHGYQLTEMSAFMDVLTRIPADDLFISEYKTARLQVITTPDSALDKRLDATRHYLHYRNEAYSIIHSYSPQHTQAINAIDHTQREQIFLNEHIQAYNDHVHFLRSNLIADLLITGYSRLCQWMPGTFSLPNFATRVPL